MSIISGKTIGMISDIDDRIALLAEAVTAVNRVNADNPEGLRLALDKLTDAVAESEGALSLLRQVHADVSRKAVETEVVIDLTVGL